MSDDDGFIVESLDVKDVRFPTSKESHGSDAMHRNPDYSCAYVIIKTKNGTKGHGLTFTLGKGTEIVVETVRILSPFILNKNAIKIFENFSQIWREITSDTQLRWTGPEKGIVHLATSALINGLWDLWARIENKPLWKLLCDLDPNKLVSTIDFRYITDLITPEECINYLNESKNLKEKRIKEIMEAGYPAYTTQAGWIGYSTTEMENLCKQYLEEGFSAFKIKVGQNLDEDVKRCELVRRVIGPQNILMLDANQMWDVNEAIERLKTLKEFRPYWIEEPTSPDDVLGHATISKHVNPNGIKVASGEMCANRVMFKQFIQAKAIQVCQIDSGRLGGVNEVLSVYFMAKKHNLAVCPHAGGIGLCEMVSHLQIFDFVCLNGSTKDRMIEYVDKHHEHFEEPAIVVNGKYKVPLKPGYGTKFNDDVFEIYEYPNGKIWKNLNK